MITDYVSSRKKSFLPIVLGGLVFVLLVAGLLFALSTLKTSKDIRQKASGSSSQIQLTLSADTIDSSHIRVNVFINTQENQLAGVDLRGTLASANASDVSITNSSGGNSLAIDDVFDKFTQSGSAVMFRTVRFAQLDPTAVTNTHGQSVPLLSFVVANPQNQQITISFDVGNSSGSVVGMPNTVVDYPASQTFSINTSSQNKKTCGQNCATDTECQDGFQCYKGLCRHQPNLEDQYCGTPPDQGIHRGCNEYCANNSECGSQFTCYFNQCRNPKNVKSTSCKNSFVVRKKAKASPSPSPETIPSDATILAVDGQPLTSPSPSPSPTPFPTPLPTLPPVSTPLPTEVPQTTDQTANTSNSSNLLTSVLMGAGLIGAGVAIYLLYKRSHRPQV